MEWISQVQSKHRKENQMKELKTENKTVWLADRAMENPIALALQRKKEREKKRVYWTAEIQEAK